MLTLSVIIPVYNEKKTIQKLIETVQSVPLKKEIVVVDDGSTDGTTEILKGYQSSRNGLSLYFHEKNLGKGAAVKTGLAAAKGDAIIIQDADLEYDPNDYMMLLEVLDRPGTNVVFGSRFLGTTDRQSLFHRITNGSYTGLCNALYGSHLTDLGTCYKLFRSNTIKSLTLNHRGFEMEAELTAKLLKGGERIAEAPISYRGRSSREGKKITWRDGLRAASCLIRYRFSD